MRASTAVVSSSFAPRRDSAPPIVSAPPTTEQITSTPGSLVPVGILMALMGYVVGTPLATLCANIMKLLA